MSTFLLFFLFFLWIPCAHHHVHKSVTCPYPEPYQSSECLRIYARVLLSLSLKFPHQIPVCTSPLIYMCHMPYPSYSLFVHPSNIWWGVQIIKPLDYQFSTIQCHFLPCRPKYLPEHYSQTPSIYILSSVGETKFHTHIKQGAKLFSII
jgi:hypothetical protein